MDIYTTDEKIYVEDLGKNLKMSNRSFLKIFQETANRVSSTVGHGVNDIKKNNTSWVLLYWRIKILKRAKYGDTLTIKTWCSFSKKIYSIRSFEMYLGEELIAIADSKWVFVDATNHNILKIPDEMLTLYGNTEKKLFDEEYKEKTKMDDSLKEIYSYKVMKRDLDPNHHVNNITFLDIANEVLDDDLYENCNEIYATYKKEAEYGDTISLYLDNNTVYLYNKDKKVLHATITLK